MNEKDMVLALAIWDLLGKSVTQKDVDQAFQRAKKTLERSRRPSKEAKISYGPRHYETE